MEAHAAATPLRGDGGGDTPVLEIRFVNRSGFDKHNIKIVPYANAYFVQSCSTSGCPIVNGTLYSNQACDESHLLWQDGFPGVNNGASAQTTVIGGCGFPALVACNDSCTGSGAWIPGGPSAADVSAADGGCNLRHSAKPGGLLIGQGGNATATIRSLRLSDLHDNQTNPPSYSCWTRNFANGGEFYLGMPSKPMADELFGWAIPPDVAFCIAEFYPMTKSEASTYFVSPRPLGLVKPEWNGVDYLPVMKSDSGPNASLPYYVYGAYGPNGAQGAVAYYYPPTIAPGAGANPWVAQLGGACNVGGPQVWGTPSTGCNYGSGEGGGGTNPSDPLIYGFNNSGVDWQQIEITYRAIPSDAADVTYINKAGIPVRLTGHYPGGLTVAKGYPEPADASQTFHPDFVASLITAQTAFPKNMWVACGTPNSTDPHGWRFVDSAGPSSISLNTVSDPFFPANFPGGAQWCNVGSTSALCPLDNCKAGQTAWNTLPTGGVCPLWQYPGCQSLYPPLAPPPNSQWPCTPVNGVPYCPDPHPPASNPHQCIPCTLSCNNSQGFACQGEQTIRSFRAALDRAYLNQQNGNLQLFGANAAGWIRDSIGFSTASGFLDYSFALRIHNSGTTSTPIYTAYLEGYAAITGSTGQSVIGDGRTAPTGLNKLYITLGIDDYQANKLDLSRAIYFAPTLGNFPLNSADQCGLPNPGPPALTSELIGLGTLSLMSPSIIGPVDTSQQLKNGTDGNYCTNETRLSENWYALYNNASSPTFDFADIEYAYAWFGKSANKIVNDSIGRVIGDAYAGFALGYLSSIDANPIILNENGPPSGVWPTWPSKYIPTSSSPSPCELQNNQGYRAQQYWQTPSSSWWGGNLFPVGQPPNYNYPVIDCLDTLNVFGNAYSDLGQPTATPPDGTFYSDWGNVFHGGPRSPTGQKVAAYAHPFQDRLSNPNAQPGLIVGTATKIEIEFWHGLSSSSYRAQHQSETCRADISSDEFSKGVVDAHDLLQMLATWQEGQTCTGNCSADLNADGRIDSHDLHLLLAAFGGTCP